MDDELTTVQWDIADAIARLLVREGVKVDVLQKAIAYLRTYGKDEGAKFFTYLQVLAKEGQRVGHSRQTQGYYVTLHKTCQQYLQEMSGDGLTMLRVLGWAARLVRYYSDGVPTGEIAESIVRTERPLAILTEQFSIGQILDATIESKNGVKVTYRMANGEKRTNPEHKRHQELQIGASVKVAVVSLKEDGMFNKIRLYQE